MDKALSRAALTALAILLAGQAAAVEWKVSLWGKRRASTEHVHKLAELVAEKSGGEFTMNIDYGGLSKSTDNLDGLSLGAFEMAQFCAGYHADKNPTLTVLELPFLGVSTLKEDLAVSQAIYAHPATREDMARWNAKLLMPSPSLQASLVGTGTPPRSVEDFEGARVRATGGIARAFEAIGAVATEITAAETYEAMSSGVVDMVAFAPHGHVSYRTIDLGEWSTTNLFAGTTDCPVAVSIDAYEALSAPHRYALVSSVDAALDHYLQNYRTFMDDWDALIEAKGIERVTLPDEEIAKLHKAATPIHQQWIKDMEARGLPGEDLYDTVRQTLRDEGVASN